MPFPVGEERIEEAELDDDVIAWWDRETGEAQPVIGPTGRERGTRPHVCHGGQGSER